MDDRLNVRPEDLAMAMRDEPMDSGDVKFAELMVDSRDIPLDWKEKLWGFLNQETVLSRSDQKDRIRAENRFGIMRNLRSMGQPYYKNTIVDIADSVNAQNRSTVEMNRSVGGFERINLTKTVTEVVTNKMDQQRERGWLVNFKRKLGFGKPPEQEKRDQYGS